MWLNYFELLILTLINSGGIFLIIVLTANTIKDRLYSWLSLITLCIVGWANFAYLGYIQQDPMLAMDFYRVNGAFVSIFMYAEYVLYVEHFLKIKNIIFRWIILILSLVFTFLILFTDKVLKDAVWQGWGNEIHFGELNDFFSLFFLLLNVGLIITLIVKYFKFQTEEKQKALYFVIGTILFMVFNIVFNVITPALFLTTKYQHFGDYAGVLFLIFTAYAILRKQFMNVKIALTALLIGVIGMLVVVDIFALSHNLVEQGIKFALLLFFAIISIILVRNVLEEIRQKEELAKINIALDKSRKQYLDLSTEQKDIIDVMGHEIRTPLTAIVYQVNLHKKHTLPFEIELIEEAKNLPKLSKLLPYLLDTIKITARASTHATALVTDMIETARIDKQRFELKYEKFDLVDALKSSVDLMEKTFDFDVDNNHSEFKINFVESELETLEVEADKTRINQVIYALLNNAIKYRDPQKDNVVVNVSLRTVDKNAIIEIADNGLGIEKEDIAKLGKKFLRLNPKTNGNLPRPGGTGLGLFVVKGILHYHNGELIITSDGIGKGSKFTVQFPIQKPSNE